MAKDFEQVKINIPKTNKRIIDRCKKLAAQRKLSTHIIRLLTDELDKAKKGESLP